MNVFISHNQNPKIIGLAQGIKQATGYNVQYWNNQMPIFGLLEQVPIDILFFTNQDISPVHFDYCKNTFPNIKYVLMNTLPNSHEYNVKYKIDLYNGSEEYFLDFLADTELYLNGTHRPYFNSDFTVICNQEISNNNLFTTWISNIAEKFNVKIFGAKTNSPYYLGNIDLAMIKDIIASCKGMILFDDQWYNNLLINQKIPLTFLNKTDKKEKFVFNNYDELESLCQKVISQEVIFEKEDFNEQNTYKNFAKNIMEKYIV